MMLAVEQVAGASRPATIVFRAPKLPRCGCCDAITHFVICEQCQEPTCERHLERIQDVHTADKRFVCTLCALEQCEAEVAVLMTGPTGVLSALAEKLCVPTARPTEEGR